MHLCNGPTACPLAPRTIKYAMHMSLNYYLIMNSLRITLPLALDFKWWLKMRAFFTFKLASLIIGNNDSGLIVFLFLVAHLSYLTTFKNYIRHSFSKNFITLEYSDNYLLPSNFNSLKYLATSLAAGELLTLGISTQWLWSFIALLLLHTWESLSLSFLIWVVEYRASRRNLAEKLMWGDDSVIRDNMPHLTKGTNLQMRF